MLTVRDRALHQPLVADAARADTLSHQCIQLSTLFLVTTLLILGQLALGAAMRHQHAGLAIPDFPLAYGKLWPATDAGSVAHYNAQRMEITAVNPITAFQIGLQMAHRLRCAGDSWRGRLQSLGLPDARWEADIF